MGRVKSLVDTVQLNDETDMVEWTMGFGGFTVKGLYVHRRSNGVFPYRFL
jgi:hypothetical protein